MNYYLKRFLMWGFVIFFVVSLTFVLIRFLPGGPQEVLVQQYIEDGLTRSQAEQKASIVLQYNTNAPVWQQYVSYISDVLLRLDFGDSIFKNKPVMQIYVNAVPWSMFIAITTLGINWLTGIGLGALMAYKEGSRFDVGVTTFLIWANSIPFFILAIVLLVVFGYSLEWFPTDGRFSPYTTPGFNLPFLTSALHHAALPILSVILVGFGPVISMRANAIRTLGSDYIRVAKLRGLPVNRIALRYVARNAILPLYTGLVMSIGTIMGGSVILEQIFTYPGMGLVLFDSITMRDYPLMMGGFIIITVGLMTGILVADLTYGYIDPRAGSGETREAY
jgi:peptide/nickel transport system permease protein